MDIGTAKPSREDQARIPHHLIDLNSVRKPYDIVAYVRDAQVAVAEIFERGKSVVVTGGSGFYLKSFFAPVIDVVKVSDTIRAKVAALYEADGLEGLLGELRVHSVSGNGNLDIKNPRRVSRALERSIASGKDLPTLQAEFAARPEPFTDCVKHYVLLERDKENLKQRVARRAELMIEAGLIEEVEALLLKGLKGNPSAASAIGYRETIAFLDGELRRDELLPSIIQNTLHLMKKQGTWFRTQIRRPDKIVTF